MLPFLYLLFLFLYKYYSDSPSCEDSSSDVYSYILHSVSLNSSSSSSKLYILNTCFIILDFSLFSFFLGHSFALCPSSLHSQHTQFFFPLGQYFLGVCFLLWKYFFLTFLYAFFLGLTLLILGLFLL